MLPTANCMTMNFNKKLKTISAAAYVKWVSPGSGQNVEQTSPEKFVRRQQRLTIH
jgi:hypothetical protein